MLCDQENLRKERQTGVKKAQNQHVMRERRQRRKRHGQEKGPGPEQQAQRPQEAGAGGTQSEPTGAGMPSPAPTHRVRGRISASLGFHTEICGQGALAPWRADRQRCTFGSVPPASGRGPFGGSGHHLVPWPYDTLHLLCLSAAGSSPSPSARTHQSWD